MPVQQEATILVPSEDPKNKKSEEKSPNAADSSKGKDGTDVEELVSFTQARERSSMLTQPIVDEDLQLKNELEMLAERLSASIYLSFALPRSLYTRRLGRNLIPHSTAPLSRR
jgi:26S proteasome regulatory subunit N1